MNKKILTHRPVMLNEVKEFLVLDNNSTYLDCTFGYGGYTEMILNATDNSKVIAIDRDPYVEKYVMELDKKFPNRIEFINLDFATALSKMINKKFNGIVMDLGVSSMQLDNSSRGFSFMYDGPLDMRMGAGQYTAADFINNASEKEMANIIFKYGNEKFARKIAKKIVFERNKSPITNTLRFAEIIRSIVYSSKKIDPATKTFQAIRIHINDELEQLNLFLKNCQNIFAFNARLLIVSFHSLEDKIVKDFFNANRVKKEARSKYSKKSNIFTSDKWLNVLTKKPLTPNLQEIISNPRARSAKLRVVECIKKFDTEL